MRRFFRHNKTLFLGVLFLVLYSASIALATSPDAQTLDPQCLPTDPACVINLSAGAMAVGDAVANSSDSGILFVDANGNLKQNANFLFNDLTNRKSLKFGITTSGGVLNSYGSASLVFGYADTTASIETGSTGSLAHGTTWGAGSGIYAGGDGGTAFGGAINGGTINASDHNLAFGFADGGMISVAADSSQAFGYANTDNTIETSGIASFAWGSADGSDGNGLFSYIRTSGIGSQAFGYATSGGYIKTENDGSLAFGNANGSDGSGNVSYIKTQGVALAFGVATNGGYIRGGSDGSQAFGYATDNGQIKADGAGSIVFGYTAGGKIYSSGESSLVFGSVDANIQSEIYAAQPDSIAFGIAQLGGTIFSNDVGSMASGYAYGDNGSGQYSYVSSTGAGSHARGSAVNGSYIETQGIGASAFGNATNGRVISAIGAGSFAAGSTITGSISTADNSSFVFGDNVQTYQANNIIFGQNGETITEPNQFLIALGGVTKTSMESESSFGVGANGFISLLVDASHQETIIQGASINPFIVKTTTGNTCTFDTTDGTFDCPSDIRLKHNINPLDTTAFTKILSLNPVIFKYNWQKDADAAVPGFIAQEFETVFPDMVKTDSETGYKSLSYVSLIPYTVKAIQELDVRMRSVIPENLDNTAAARVKEFLHGVAVRGEAVIDTVRTHNLCVDDVCVTRDQFKRMVEQSGAQQQTVAPIVVPTVPETQEVVLEEITTPALVEIPQN